MLYPGIDLSLAPAPGRNFHPSGEPPLIVWNHRWGFDKNPALFFQVLEEIHSLGLDFRLALLGENFGMIPEGFLRARHLFQDRVTVFGHLPERADYLDHLGRGDIIISTAIQENFGMSVIEAMMMGCLPLLPDRLVYPEILPPAFHAACLYRNRHELREKLISLLSDLRAFAAIRKGIASEMQAFLWKNRINAYDDLLEELGRKAGERA